MCTMSTIKPALLPVELRKICVKGQRDSTTESTSPRQDIRVTAAAKARHVLTAKARSRERGIVREASLAFSAVCRQSLNASLKLALVGIKPYSCAPSYHSRCDCSMG